VKIFALYVINKRDTEYGKPVIYSTNINKLRDSMLTMTNQNGCYLGSTDVTNEPHMNCHTEEGKFPYAKIVEVPTLI